MKSYRQLIVLGIFICTLANGDIVRIVTSNVTTWYPARSSAGANSNANTTINTVNGSVGVRETPDEVEKRFKAAE